MDLRSRLLEFLEDTRMAHHRQKPDADLENLPNAVSVEIRLTTERA